MLALFFLTIGMQRTPSQTDVAYQYLSYFLEDDDELTRIGELYASGAMLSGNII